MVSHFIDIENIHSSVHEWFKFEAIEQSLGKAETSAERLAQQWLSKAGKRWRPFLTVCAYQSYSGCPQERVRHVALAVECFHKASLIHDDIEDGDEKRYGQETMHSRYGVPIALNTGDLLLGEGYRLIAESGFSAEIIKKLLSAASAAPRALCHGQGEELMWSSSPCITSVKNVIDIFRLKTGPAFEVALSMGAICSGASESDIKTLKIFSDFLGICYQIRDDLEDLQQQRIFPLAPSIMLAFACENYGEVCRELLESGAGNSSGTTPWLEVFDKANTRSKSEQLLRHYRHEAVRSLESLNNAGLKSLLRRTVVWILGE